MKKIYLFIIVFLYCTNVFSQTNWIQTNGPKFASIYYVTFNQQGNIYSGPDGAGIYYSTNSGASWINMPNSFVRVKTIAFGLNNYIFSGMDFPGASNSGLFRSTDNGNNWYTITTYPTECVFHLGNGLIMAGIYNGIMKSTNNGINWVSITTALENSSINTIDTSGMFIFAGGYLNGKIFRSSDSGNTWQRVYYTGFNDNITKIKTGPNNTVYAGIGGHGLFYTTNYGINWIQMNFGSSNAPLDIEINNGIIYCADNYYIFYTTNNGTNWLQMGNCVPYGNNSFTDFALRNTNEIYIGSLGSNAGLFKKFSVNKCEKLSSDFINSCITAITTLPSGEVFAGSRNSYIYRSTNSGTSWEIMNTSLSSYQINCMCVDSLHNIYAGTQNGYYRSTNSGINWSFVNSVFNNKEVYRMLCSKNGTLFASTWYGPVYKSLDNGANWVSVLNISEANIAVSPLGILFACSENDADLYKSVDNGNNWQLISHWAPFYIISSMIGCPNGNVFLGTINGTYMSTNLGDNWIVIPVLDETNLFAVNKYGHMYAYDQYRKSIYRSTNNGLPGTWTDFTSGLPANIIYGISIDRYDYLYAGTYGRGVYRTSVTTGSIINEISPFSFYLSQNYPNPFNPDTKIKFDVPASNLTLSGAKGLNVKLKIYDILGREIATLVNDKLSPGTYEVEWDASCYPSGVYFYKLITADFTETRKMVLVK
jgi:photosystem II stability/assembly factor-like uncharacterized protein